MYFIGLPFTNLLFLIHLLIVVTGFLLSRLKKLDFWRTIG